MKQQVEQKQAQKQILRELRRFHFEGITEEQTLSQPSEQLLPTLLSPFRDVAKIRYDFPLFVRPSKDPEKVSLPLSDWLSKILDQYSSKGARILRDNLIRIEKFIHSELDQTFNLVSAKETLAKLESPLLAELKLSESEVETFTADYRGMLEQIEEDGQLLTFSDQASFNFLLLAAQAILPVYREEFRAKVKTIVRELRKLLDVERSKDSKVDHLDVVTAEVGSHMALHFDIAKLASVMGEHRGSTKMEKLRRTRLEDTIKTLQDYMNADEEPLLTFIHPDYLGHIIPEASEVDTIQTSTPFAKAMEHFEAKIAEMESLHKAVRIGELEIKGTYNPQIHDSWLASFDWRHFSEAELALLPGIVVLQRGKELLESEIPVFSQMILSSLPIKTLIFAPPTCNPTEASISDPSTFRFEVGYLGLTYRNAIVHQSTPARPKHLYEGFITALSKPIPSVHVLSVALSSNVLPDPAGSWLMHGAAIESRAHPLFFFDPTTGESWAKNFQLTENPETDADWPVYKSLTPHERDNSDDLEIPFTFADFVLLDPNFREHFRVLPQDARRDTDVVLLTDYLELDQSQAIQRIPFIWAMDDQYRLHKVALTFDLVEACRSRLKYWHTLQEFAGIRNEYVEQALLDAEEAATKRLEEERQELISQHEAEISTAKEEAASEAMERLTGVLLGLDLQQVPTGSPSIQPAQPTQAVASAPQEEAVTVVETVAEEEPEEEESVAFDDPWVDTPLCTSCNDCVVLNPRLFLYDENKQVIMGDPSEGTFAQLVTAAKKCPSRCIHPGKPQNPNEENLEALIIEAKPFQ